jgi:hypothetical protein
MGCCHGFIQDLGVYFVVSRYDVVAIAFDIASNNNFNFNTNSKFNTKPGSQRRKTALY